MRTRFNQGLAKVRAAVEDEGLEAVRALHLRVQAASGESPNLAPLPSLCGRLRAGWRPKRTSRPWAKRVERRPGRAHVMACGTGAATA